MLYLRAAALTRRIAPIAHSWFLMSLVPSAVCFVGSLLVLLLFLNSVLLLVSIGLFWGIAAFIFVSALQLVPLPARLEEAERQCQSSISRLQMEAGPILRQYKERATAYAKAREALHIFQECEAKRTAAQTLKAEEESLRLTYAQQIRQYQDLTNWHSLAGTEFELFLERWFSIIGLKVQRIGQSGDQGVDLIVMDGETRIAVQAKGYPNSTVGNDAIQQVFAGKTHYQCAVCIVATNSTFTASAKEIAASTGCLLMGPHEIEAFMRGHIPWRGQMQTK